MTRVPERVGILGGTFDPIHYGHLDAADAARDALQLDRILLMPARTPPHRPVEPRASAFHRFAMAALAGLERGMCVSDLELRREGPSYTALTLEALHREGFEPSQLFFITGSDAFAEVGSWYDYPRILELANFVVVSRPGSTPPAGVRPAGREPSLPQVHAVAAQTPDVSSSQIRRCIAAGEAIDGLAPPPVVQHIQRHRLYVPTFVPAVQ